MSIIRNVWDHRPLGEDVVQVFLTRPLTDEEHTHCEELLGEAFSEDGHGYPPGDELYAHWMNIGEHTPELEAYLSLLS